MSDGRDRACAWHAAPSSRLARRSGRLPPGMQRLGGARAAADPRSPDLAAMSRPATLRPTCRTADRGGRSRCRRRPAGRRSLHGALSGGGRPGCTRALRTWTSGSRSRRGCTTVATLNATVVLGRGRRRSRREVTNAEFAEFLDATGYRPWSAAPLPPGRTTGRGRTSAPVTFVDLDDARAYSAWRGARLPTEDEWQLAGETGRARARRAAGLELDRERAHRRPHPFRHAQGRQRLSRPKARTGTSTVAAQDAGLFAVRSCCCRAGVWRGRDASGSGARGPRSRRSGGGCRHDRAARGLRVVDAATLFAGPMAATHLGDFGADVIKVEHPRQARPGADARAGQGRRRPLVEDARAQQADRHRRPRRARGREVFLRLAAPRRTC